MDLSRWLFLTLAFVSILSTGWFGIPLAPHYFTDQDIDPISIIFVISSILGCIWGLMAYREFTKSKNYVTTAKLLCKKMDPLIGQYNYKSFNPTTKKYEKGFVPLSPVDFWDPETPSPKWLDKGKYWYVLLCLKYNNKNILLKILSDDELNLFSEKQNVATTSKELLNKNNIFKKNYRYVVSIPQWLVMNTEINRFSDLKSRLNMSDSDLGILVNSINQNIMYATNEIIEHEIQRIKYHVIFSSFFIYINKSLPIRILYKEISQLINKYIPVQEYKIIENTNQKLGYISNRELIDALILLAKIKNISSHSIDKIHSLLKFLNNMYDKQGLGYGSSKYHNFHHSLEVAYVSLQMLPEKLYEFEFTWRDYELLLVGAALHDYDPCQQNFSMSIGLHRSEGPQVERTINEISTIKIHEAYYIMNASEFQNYFREYYSYSLPPIEYSTTHPEYLQSSKKPVESTIIELLIWRTDYPFALKENSQKKFYSLAKKLDSQKIDSKKYVLLSEVLWLADLSVTYLSSDPISAWDRVINLYDELYLPKLEAISKTDQFFSQFIEIDLFKSLLNNKNFPDIFKQRWNIVYQFYHEGNPSTQINRTILRSNESYQIINMEIGIRTGSMLYQMAMENPYEYFIGIGTDQEAVLNIKNKFMNLKTQNAACFWGNALKLLPHIQSKSVDNMFLIIDKDHFIPSLSELSLIFTSIDNILKNKGIIQILITINDDIYIDNILKIAESFSFHKIESNITAEYFHKTYFLDNSFKNKEITLLTFQN
ncbi:MAG: hypothetical protein ACPKPY_04560 [Nitrososphaeraceae archaeon]